MGEGFGLEQPGTAPTTTRADKSLGPTPLEKVLRARAFRRKAVLKLKQRFREPSLRSRHNQPVTGGVPVKDRPAGAVVYEKLDRDEFDVLVVYDNDRIGRDEDGGVRGPTPHRPEARASRRT